MADLVQAAEIAAPPERVWAEITKVDAPQRAMLDAVLDTTFAPDAPLAYRSQNGRLTFIVGRIVEVTPPRRFAHSFHLSGSGDPTTLVTWELEPVGEGATRVTVTHSGWPAGSSSIDRVDRMWAASLRELRSLLETGEISRGANVRQTALRVLEFAAPKRFRTDRVEPLRQVPRLPGS